MNIAHLLPFSASFPLVKHNGRYNWALRLAREQVNQGHTVTIFAAPGSSDDSDIIWRSISSHSDESNSINTALIVEAFQDTSFDIYHSHFDFLPHTLSTQLDRPLVTTQHWFPSEEIASKLRLDRRHSSRIVPVTQLMKRTDESLGLHPNDVIYHGVDLQQFSPDYDTSKSRLLFVGRITESKGVLEAVKVAIDAGCGLDIVGKLREKDRPYWESIRPLVDGEVIRFLGPLPATEVAERMSKALALLFPSKAPEAFGLVTIEAQASGAPVIISDVGASSELVLHGETGFVVNTHAGYVQAIQQIHTIDRTECRKNAERFDESIMFTRYAALYSELVPLSVQ